ncbi:hypothetical protein [Marinobacter sp. CHS3-4]|uniref:hypothetical protein n=1 Tax=Marinobacter sp. CHS3-4 TaxID=3045174 RepID=UPI0024B5486E|nr:hypothetical protein [Marinobacter sp. CHS3-4]MDI9245788.1 hypothetical protein [Marinobacter sp. CHS3-4]
MKYSDRAVFILCLLSVLMACSKVEPDYEFDIRLQPGEIEWIGKRVFENECAGRRDCLVHWNRGEAFPSLGIGHFIWYPEKVNGPFVESFPAMIEFLVTKGITLPESLETVEPFDAPWESRASLIQKSNTDRVRELRDFLFATRGLQAEFLINRASRALTAIIEAMPENARASTAARIEDLVRTPGGVYALIDYVNFKGEGLAESERYSGRGWGLRQVFEEMDQSKDVTALESFRKAAALVLTRRANHAKNEIEKQQWLPGWLKRLETYREPDWP